LAYLPSFGNVRLRLTAKGTEKEVVKEFISIEIKKLTIIISEFIIGFDDGEIIEAIIGKLLVEKKQTLATAESCTGGNIAKIITAIPGASNYFVGSVVAYQAEIKINELYVEEDLIKKYSVVSSQVAEAMARGIQRKFKTTYAIATTGNAGPTVDLTDTTVGTVFIAIATFDKVFSREFFFGKPREKVIERTSIKALEMLHKEILKNK
jgi:nicotinamide-nucleotide amidase